MKSSGEDLDSYLARVSRMGGKTGIAPETLLGFSPERQLITPAAYSRFGEELEGSVFASEGKVGTFGIQELPEGFWGKVPIIRTMLSKYTNIDIYKGSYESATAEAKGFSPSKTLDMSEYGASYGKTLSLPKSLLSRSLATPFMISMRKAAKSSKPSKSTSSYAKLVSSISKPSKSKMSKSISRLTSNISKMSKPSVSRMNSSMMSLSKSASNMSNSLISSSIKSVSRAKPSPYLPSPSSSKSASLFPSFSMQKKKGKIPKGIWSGDWMKKQYPISDPDQFLAMMLGGKRRK